MKRAVMVLVLIGMVAGSTLPKWVQELSYQAGEVHPITLSSYGIPEILIAVNGSPVRVQFDTGNSGPLTLTTAVEKDISYELVGQGEELNPDGTHRGSSSGGPAESDLTGSSTAHPAPR